MFGQSINEKFKVRSLLLTVMLTSLINNLKKQETRPNLQKNRRHKLKRFAKTWRGAQARSFKDPFG